MFQKIFSINIMLNLLFTLSLYGSDKVIINEIFLDFENCNISWVEIFNPLQEPVTLESFFTSHVRTPNQLPIEVKENGGLAIGPQEYVVLCADIDKLKATRDIPKVLQKS